MSFIEIMHLNTQPIYMAEPLIQESLKEWRDCQGSLTEKLKARTGSIHLEILSQNWIKTTWWDTYFLKLSDTHLFQREIIMKSRGQEYWYARTIIPHSCFYLDSAFFKRLEKEPIKNLLFNESRVQRIRMITYPIDQQCIEFFWSRKHLPQLKNTLWVRLAEYVFQNKGSFYLAELLFPELGDI